MYLNKIIDLIDNLNDELADFEVNEAYRFTLLTDGYTAKIYFGTSEYLWFSEEGMSCDEDKISLREYLIEQLQADIANREEAYTVLHKRGGEKIL